MNNFLKQITRLTIDLPTRPMLECPIIQVWCDQHKFRKRIAAKTAISGYTNLSKNDCGPHGILWRWWRDRKMRLRKQKRFI